MKIGGIAIGAGAAKGVVIKVEIVYDLKQEGLNCTWQNYDLIISVNVNLTFQVELV